MYSYPTGESLDGLITHSDYTCPNPIIGTIGNCTTIIVLTPVLRSFDKSDQLYSTAVPLQPGRLVVDLGKIV